MRIYNLLIITSFTSLLNFSCKSDNPDKETNNKEPDSLMIEQPEVKMGNFYESNTASENSVVLADTVIYYTVIKNPDPDDDWQEKCLQRLNRKALSDIVFNAIYNGRLTPYDFMTEQPMSIEDVRELDRKNPRSLIAKVEFTEEWYFNENDMTFTKRVHAIMLGYERKSPEEVKYTAGVKVYLTGEKMNINKKQK